ncbi:MAG: DUF4860 domain-containing protein [Oscillospiraceae bacterium]|nr:DUF4860 domain-containing protein [Oscillospiraceae bacterium]
MKPTGKIGGAAALMLFCVFVMSVFTVLALGIGTYQNIAAASSSGYGERTCLSYVWTKIKAGDEAGMISTGDFHGIPALFIDERHGRATYRTAIYFYDGWIRELFYESGYDYLPRDGVPIVSGKSFTAQTLKDGLIEISSGDESLLIQGAQ